MRVRYHKNINWPYMGMSAHSEPGEAILFLWVK